MNTILRKEYFFNLSERRQFQEIGNMVFVPHLIDDPDFDFKQIHYIMDGSSAILEPKHVKLVETAIEKIRSTIKSKQESLEELMVSAPEFSNNSLIATPKTYCQTVLDIYKQHLSALNELEKILHTESEIDEDLEEYLERHDLDTSNLFKTK